MSLRSLVSFRQFLWISSMLLGLPAGAEVAAQALPEAASTTPVPAVLTRFRDTGGHWAAACIERADALKGDGNGRFRPEATMSRAEFSALLLAAFPQGAPLRQGPDFTDVPSRHWASRAIGEAYRRGYVAGYSSRTFRPDEPIVRSQAIVMLQKAAVASRPALTANASAQTALLALYYQDAAAIPAYAQDAIAAATLAQQVVNYPEVSYLRPQQAITRGEVAALLCQLTRDGTDARYQVPDLYIVTLANRWRDRLVQPDSQLGARFSQGLAPRWIGFNASGQALYDYVRPNLEAAFPGTYAAVSPFDESGQAVVRAVAEAGEAGRWGVINTSGQWVIEPRYGLFYTFAEGLAIVSRDAFPAIARTEVIDRQGNTVFALPPTSTHTAFAEGLLGFANEAGRWGFLDKTGKVAIAPAYDAVEPFAEGLAQVSLNGRYGFIDRSGKVVIPMDYAEAQSFSEGLVAARREAEGQWGYLDATGKWAIAPQFERVQPFSEGLAGVALGSGAQEKWGYVDRAGNLAIAPQFFSLPESTPASDPEQFGADIGFLEARPMGVSAFREGFAAVRQGSAIGYIDRQGRWQVAPEAFAKQIIAAGVVTDGSAWVTFADGSSGLLPVKLPGSGRTSAGN